jgi:hypothetical protein
MFMETLLWVAVGTSGHRRGLEAFNVALLLHYFS